MEAKQTLALLPFKKLLIYFILFTPVLIIAISISYYLVAFLPSKEKMRNELEKEKIRLEAENSKDKEAKLEECIAEAEARFKRIKDINSEPDPKPDYPDARQWNSNELADSTIKEFQNNQDLCVKKYK